MNKRLHIHKKASSSASKSVHSQFQSRPNTSQAQPHPAQPQSQTKIENQEFQQHKFEATKLEIQAKYGTITPLVQERLTVLQASTSDLLQRRLEHASRFGHSLAKIAINRADAPPPQSIQPKGTSGKPEESNQETFIDQRFRAALQIEPWSMGGGLPIREPLVQPKLTIGQPGDKYEQEADRVAAKVVSQISAPAPQQSGQSQPVQREAIPEEEDDLQMNPEISTIQREELPDEEELQMKPRVQLQPGEGGMAATPDLETSIQQARGSGQSLADTIREPMEQAFGADFSSVKVHTDAQSDQFNKSIQARAFTTGRDIFFRQGEYNPGSRQGQELLAHELTHVVQQNGSTVQRVQSQAKGEALLTATSVTANLLSPTAQLSGTIQRVTVEEVHQAVKTLRNDGVTISDDDVTQYINHAHNRLGTIPKTRIEQLLRQRFSKGKLKKFQKQDRRDQQRRDAAEFVQTDNNIVNAAELAAQKICELIKSLPPAAKASELLPKIKQCCRASTPDDCVRTLRGHLFELVSLHMAHQAGATLLDASGKADTLYKQKDTGKIIATQNKWATPNSLGGNIYAALRQLTGRAAARPEQGEDSTNFENPPSDATRMVDVALEGDAPQTEDEIAKLNKQVSDIYQDAYKKYNELHNQSNAIRIVFVNPKKGMTTRFTFSTSNDTSKLDLTEKPKDSGEGAFSSNANGDTLLLDLPNWVNAIAQLGIQQRLNLFI